MSLLPHACVCGHDHETDRGEHVELCLDCSCSEMVTRCQNCGAAAEHTLRSMVAGREYEACSRRCALQIDYAARLASGVVS